MVEVAMVFFNAVGAFMAHDTFCSGGVVDQVLAFLFNLAVVPSGAHFSRLATNRHRLSLA